MNKAGESTDLVTPERSKENSKATQRFAAGDSTMDEDQELNVIKGNPSSDLGLLPCLLILGLAIALVFGQAITFSFLEYDDEVNLTKNPFISTRPLDQVFVFWAQGYESLYIPVTYTFWAVLAAASSVTGTAGLEGGLNPALFHFANVVLHVIISCEVFLLIRLLWGSNRAALVGAMLFALHPLHVEAVAWVSEAKGLLSASFGLLSMLVFLSIDRKAVETGGSERDVGWKKRALLYLCSTMLFVLSLLAKPSAVVIPLMAFAIEFGIRQKRFRDIALPMLGWVVLAGLVTIATARLQEDTAPSQGIGDRVFTVVDSFAFYFQKTLWPFGLTPVYDRPSLAEANALTFIVILIPFLCAAVLLWRSDRYVLGTCLLVFFVGLMPNLGFVGFTFQNISTVADRYAFLALLGPAMMLGWVALRCESLWFEIIIGVYFCGLALLSGVQTSRWKDDKTLFTYAVSMNPQSADAHNVLGNVAASEGDFDTARDHYEQALQVRPKHFRVWYNLGVLLFDLEEFDQAAECFSRSISYEPSFLPARQNLGLAYLELGLDDRAVEVMQNTIQLPVAGPSDTHRLGLTLIRLERWNEAENVYRQAVARWPDWGDAHLQLARCLTRKGKHGEARGHAELARELDPTLPRLEEFEQTDH